MRAAELLAGMKPELLEEVRQLCRGPRDPDWREHVREAAAYWNVPFDVLEAAMDLVDSMANRDLISGARR